jgi:hypothetical protein
MYAPALVGTRRWLALVLAALMVVAVVGLLLPWGSVWVVSDGVV